jgi:hypothetical protein
MVLRKNEKFQGVEYVRGLSFAIGSLYNKV